MLSITYGDTPAPDHDDRMLCEQILYGLENNMRKKFGDHKTDTTKSSDIFVSMVG